MALDVVGPSDVFHTADALLAQKGRDRDGYELVFSAVDPGLVSASSGLRLHAEGALGRGDVDTLLVPGGVAAEAASENSATVQAVREAARRAKRVVSVCSGAFFLAAAGILNGRRATTHWAAADRFAGTYPGVRLEPDAIYVRDGTVATSGGVTAGIDLALALVEDDYGPGPPYTAEV